MSVGRVVVEVVAEADTRAFDGFVKHLEKVADKHWLTIRATKNLVKAMKPLATALKKSGKGMASITSRFKKYVPLQKQATGASKKLASSMKKVASAAKKSTIAIRAGISAFAQYSAVAAKAGSKLGAAGISKGLKIAKKGMLALGGATIAGAYKFASLETTMRQVGIVADISQGEVNNMIERLVKKTPGAIFGAQEMAEAMASIGSMGVFAGESSAEVATQIEDIASTASKLAVASGFDDITASSETLMGAMRTFGYEMTDNADVANILMQAANASALSMDDMGTALQFVGQRSDAMGFSLNDTLAALGTLRNMNVDAGVASRSLSQALSSLTSPSEEGAKWMRRLGLEVTDAEGNFLEMPEILANVATAFENIPYEDQKKRMEVIEEMFGAMGARAIIPLVETMDDATGGFRVMHEAMNDIDPSILQDNFDIMSQSMGNQIEGLKHTIETLGNVIGSAFLAPLMQVGDDGTSVMGELTKVLTDPKIIAALTSIGGAFADLVKNILPVFADLIQMLAPHVAKLVQFFADLLGQEEVQEFLRGLIAVLDMFLSALMPVLDELLPVIKMLFKAMTPFLPLLGLFGKGVALVAKLLVPLIKIVVAVLKVLEPFIPIILSIAKVMSGIWGAAISLVTEFLAWMIDVVAGFIKIGEDIGVIPKGASEAMKAAATEVRGFGDSINELTATINEFETSDFVIPEAGEYGTTTEGMDAETASYTTNITIEGNTDDETVEEIEDALLASYNATGHG